ncbi:MAG: hypothetical protein Ct9H300mP1_18130 [Planctomycetaceae bacterium]|nr:MAG: hypothetical protein Ct9H300mP1_18130 [Planctomycetaceae bacterium]
MLNTDRRGSTVLLFVRPEGGISSGRRSSGSGARAPRSRFPIGPGDRPNIFVEAITVSDGKLHSKVRQLFVPPEKRVINVAVKPSAEEYRPGGPATLDVSLTDAGGKPFSGSLVLTMYDKSVEYISGGSKSRRDPEVLLELPSFPLPPDGLQPHPLDRQPGETR